MNKQEQIAEILTITNPGENLSNVLKLSFGSYLEEIPGGPEAFDKALTNNYAFLEKRMKAAYELFYSAEEVDAMHSYYTSEAGRSVAKKSTMVGTALHQVGEEWGKAIANDVTTILDIK